MTSLKSALKFSSEEPRIYDKRSRIQFGPSEMVPIVEKSWFGLPRFFSSNKTIGERTTVKTNSGRETWNNQEPIELSSIGISIILSSNPIEALETLNKYKQLLEQFQIAKYNGKLKKLIIKEYRGKYRSILTNDNLNNDLFFDIENLKNKIATINPESIQLAEKNDEMLRKKGFLYGEDNLYEADEDDGIPPSERESLYGGKKRKTKRKSKKSSTLRKNKKASTIKRCKRVNCKRVKNVKNIK
jgi:hypothetical protein